MVVKCPFTILVDDREGLPYSFHGIRAVGTRRRDVFEVPTRRLRLATGDYSVAGLDGHVTVERKSLGDLFGTLGQNRQRFREEHVRMAAMDCAAVIIEASLEEVLCRPPRESKLSPASVVGTWMSWTCRFGVPWFWAEDRRLAEILTFRLLSTFWKQARRERPFAVPGVVSPELLLPTPKGDNHANLAHHRTLATGA